MNRGRGRYNGDEREGSRGGRGRGRGRGYSTRGPRGRYPDLPRRNPPSTSSGEFSTSASSTPHGAADGSSSNGRQPSLRKSRTSHSSEKVYKPKVNHPSDSDQPSTDIANLSLRTEELQLDQNLAESMSLGHQREIVSSSEPRMVHNVEGSKTLTESNTLVSPVVSLAKQGENSPLLTPQSKDTLTSYRTDPDEHSVDNADSEHAETSGASKPFDICVPKIGGLVVLKASVFLKNREKRNEGKRSMDPERGNILRSGMIHLKGYFSIDEQVKIVKRCRDLGVGSGGFYQPGYRDGATLRLRMMCLGKNWDPEKGEYGIERPFDGAKPPAIPLEFNHYVERAMLDSFALLELKGRRRNAEDRLPSMKPNICIVNFYTATGRLGLHQDKDESQESISKKLPVVSFSFGDSADFLFGDGRDAEKAEKVVLESGDVLIFGGKSRLVFHGVAAIHPNTAPNRLLDETGLRPGRLNLTFREY